jgi:anti-sigma factor RsiW
MTCDEFLDRYTEFRDGLITSPRELPRFTRHLAQCPSCHGYDAALRQGVGTLRGVETIEPSAEFRSRLERRLARERELLRGPALPSRLGVAAALFLIVAVMLLARAGVRRSEAARLPALAPVPFPKPVAQAGVPFVAFQDPRASVVFGNPNPYGTALVQPIAAGR